MQSFDKKKKWCCQSVYSKILVENTNKNAKYPSKTEQEMRRSKNREEEISGTHIHGFVAFHLIWVYDEKWKRYKQGQRERKN